MTDKEDKKFCSLTFSQREGYVDLPETVQSGILTKQFRNRVWFILATNLDERDLVSSGRDRDVHRFRRRQYWNAFLATYWIKILERPHDEFKIPDRSKTKKWLRSLILEGSYHKVTTVLECMLRLINIPEELANDIEECFGELSTYFVDRSSEPVCVVPVTSEEMKQHTKCSLDNISKSPLADARTRLQKATEQLKNKDFPASVRESIQAVESATLQIYSDSSGKFSDAVNYLEKQGLLKHPTWKVILTKLYAYAGDRKDVRHSPPKPKDTDVDFNEAILVYGVCISIVDYLARQSDRLKDK